MRTDLAVLASVRDAAADVIKTVPRIDALICNAAIAQVPTRKLTQDGFESQLGTNPTTNLPTVHEQTFWTSTIRLHE